MDLDSSIDLKNRKMNSRSPTIPKTSVSKKPSEVLWRKDGANARKSAANKPTAFPPISLPTKYIIRHERVPNNAGKNDVKAIKSTLTPNNEIML